jgi:hypothetical protein
LEDYFLLEEIQEIMKNHFELDVSRHTINNYRNWGLLGMEPISGSGRLTGRWVKHPRSNVADVYAASILLNGKYREEVGNFFGEFCPRISAEVVAKIRKEAERQQEEIDNNLKAARKSRQPGENLEQLYDKVVRDTQGELRKQRLDKYGLGAGDLYNTFVYVWYSARARAFKVLQEIGK